MDQLCHFAELVQVIAYFEKKFGFYSFGHVALNLLRGRRNMNTIPGMSKVRRHIQRCGTLCLIKYDRG